eukprot:SAG31_NODE_8275_length_1482_cov_1.229212_1_plen_95_part_00
MFIVIMMVRYTVPRAILDQGWNDVYNAEIVPPSLTPEQVTHVLGAEVCMVRLHCIASLSKVLYVDLANHATLVGRIHVGIKSRRACIPDRDCSA